MPYLCASVRIAFRDRDNVAADLLVEVHHARQTAYAVAHHHVREQQGERLIANDVTGAPDRVSKAKRGLLTGKAGGARRRQHVLERFQLHRLAARPQGLLEFGLDIEMVFDDGFVATGDEHEVFDTGCHGLFDNILDHGLVDDSQHLLGHGLGCGKKSGPQPCNRQDGFSDFTCHSSSIFLILHK
jgi:hypothetical protein